YQVAKFQVRAARRADVTTATISSGSTSTIPAIVSATAEPSKNGPVRMHAGGGRGAGPGRAARVATSVAIEFEASWKPFVKAKANASATATTQPRSMPGE